MKRTQLISRLRRHARKTGLRFEVIQRRGKGSHVVVVLGPRRTIVKDGELKPGYLALVLKQLGVARGVLN